MKDKILTNIPHSDGARLDDEGQIENKKFINRTRAEMRWKIKSITHKQQMINAQCEDLTQSIIQNHFPAAISSLKEVHKITTISLKFGVGMHGQSIPQPTHAQLMSTEAGTYGGLVFNILYLIQAPIIYLYARLKNQPNPITPGQGAQFIYKAVLFAATIVAMVIPAIATTLGLVAAFVAGLVAITSLGKLLHEYYEAKHSNKTINDDIIKGQEALNQLQDELVRTYNTILTNPLSPGVANLTYLELPEKEKCYEEKYNELEALIDKKNVNDKIIASIKDGAADKSVGLLTASLGIAGAVISLFFPPAGLIILAGASIFGSIYGLARLAQNYHEKYKSWRAVKDQEKQTIAFMKQQATLDGSLTPILNSEAAVLDIPDEDIEDEGISISLSSSNDNNGDEAVSLQGDKEITINDSRRKDVMGSATALFFRRPTERVVLERAPLPIAILVKN